MCQVDEGGLAWTSGFGFEAEAGGSPEAEAGDRRFETEFAFVVGVHSDRVSVSRSVKVRDHRVERWHPDLRVAKRCLDEKPKMFEVFGHRFGFEDIA